VPRVLIVDDDRTTVGLLKTLLELDGFSVNSAPDRETALQEAEAFTPDVFVVDFHLADYNGTEFVSELRQNKVFERTPIIMASGSDRQREALASGADYFLVKPFDPGKLVELLFKVLE
jgi:two-component system chemotaxis response regulator CheY